MLNQEMSNGPAGRASLRRISICVALVLGASGCTVQPDTASANAAGSLPAFQGPPPSATNAMAPAAGGNTSAAGNGEAVTAPVDTSELDDAPPPTGVMLPEEPPLSAAELAQLEGMDGLVRASAWNAPISALITETKVSRAYLEWKSRFFKVCDDGSVYVLKNDYTGSEQVASEGIAYGMLLAVAMGDRPAFDGLWQYYREHRNGNGVMNWLHSPCGGQIDGNGASDADLDAAMALVLADNRYGGFAADARELVAAIGTHETQICDDGLIVLKPGDAWGGCGDVVNPSYFSPGYYRRFALIQPERAEFWNQFASDTYQMLRGMQDEAGGLLPDWGYDGRADDGDRGQYGYEAVRAPWRIALDLAWSNNADPRTFLQRMSQTVDTRGGITAMADDESFAEKRNSAFLGSLSLSGLAVSQAKFDAYVAEWEAYETLDDQWYYQASLRVLFLITAGGFFPLTY